jgi:hypothetical protein
MGSDGMQRLVGIDSPAWLGWVGFQVDAHEEREECSGFPN